MNRAAGGAADPWEVLTAGRAVACRRAPYLQPMIYKIVVREASGLGTVGVSRAAVMSADLEFVTAQTPATMGGLWVHEALHLVVDHGGRRGAREAARWNAGADLWVNPIVRELGLALPDGGLWPKDLGLEEALTADEYYALLDGMPARLKPGPANGACGSCAGLPLPGEGDPWADPDARSAQELARTVRSVEQGMTEARAVGSLPLGLQRVLDAIRPPRIPWQRELARAVHQAIDWAAGARDHRYDGPSRKQGGLGYGAGCPVLPRLRQALPRIGVAVDTSGSMGAAELGAAMSEVAGVLKVAGAGAWFLAIDSEVHGGMRRVMSAREAVAHLRGGGGTDFRPAFEAFTAERPRPDVVVFCTDGFGPAPAAPPPYRVIWLLIGRNAVRPASWGQAIRLEEGCDV